MTLFSNIFEVATINVLWFLPHLQFEHYPTFTIWTCLNLGVLYMSIDPRCCKFTLTMRNIRVLYMSIDSRCCNFKIIACPTDSHSNYLVKWAFLSFYNIVTAPTSLILYCSLSNHLAFVRQFYHVRQHQGSQNLAWILSTYLWFIISTVTSHAKHQSWVIELLLTFIVPG